MNNILVENDIFINLEENSCFTINNNSIITLYISNKNLDLSFIINKDIKCFINIFNIDSSLKINIDVLENSHLNFVNSVINYNNLDFNLNINHNKNASSDIINHGLNINNGTMNFIINGIVKKGMTNTKLKQDNKIINLKNGIARIEPNLLIDELDTICNHSAYIFKYRMEDIFYLQSRGISKNEAFKLLTKAYLLGNTCLNDDIKSIFIDIIYKIYEEE